MPASSAEPDRLEAYPGQLAGANEQLTRLATRLDMAMREFASGAGAYLPDGFDAAEAGNLVRGLRDESRYLEDWVVSVARAFRAADPDADGDGIFWASDSVIDERVGQPTIAGQRAEIAGRRAAHDLTDALLAMGIDPTNLTRDQLQQLVTSSDNPNLRDLYQQMQGIAEHMHDPAFATGFYDSMGTDGIRATLGVVDSFAYRRDDWMGSVQDNLLAPLVGGWALATRSPETEDERVELLNTTSPAEQRHLSLLMSGNPASYDAEWLANGAERILVTGRRLNVAQVPADRSTEWPYDDHALGLPTVIAMRALDGNHDAANRFMHRGPDHLRALIYPDPLSMPQSTHLYEDAERFRNELETRGASIVAEGVNKETNPNEAYRAEIMRNAINAVGTEGAPLNAHMYDALADGVEDNMPVIDQHINGGWDDPNKGKGPPDGAQNTYEFFEQLMRDERATDRVNAAVDEYALDRLTLLPDDGDHRTHRIEQLGAIKGITTMADVNAVVASAEDTTAANQATRDMPGNVANWVAGRFPVLGDINDTASLSGVSVGDLTNSAVRAVFPEDYAELDRAHQVSIAAETAADIDMQLLLAAAEDPNRIDLPIADMTQAEHRDAIKWAYSDGVYDREDHDVFYAGAQRATRSFRWEWDERTN
jgi:hypothetical protein